MERYMINVNIISTSGYIFYIKGLKQTFFFNLTVILIYIYVSLLHEKFVI